METFLPKATAFAVQHTWMVVAWVAVFIATIYSLIKTATNKVKEISNQQLVELVNQQQGIVIDLRSLEDFKRGHITKSIQILPTEIKNGIVKPLENHQDTPIIVVCAMGITAKSIAATLIKQGFHKVFVLKEGISGWKAENMPLIKKN